MTPISSEELREKLLSLAFSTVTLCGQKTFQMGDRITRFSDEENATITKAAAYISTADQRIAELEAENESLQQRYSEMALHAGRQRREAEDAQSEASRWKAEAEGAREVLREIANNPLDWALESRQLADAFLSQHSEDGR